VGWRNDNSTGLAIRNGSGVDHDCESVPLDHDAVHHLIDDAPVPDSVSTVAAAIIPPLVVSLIAVGPGMMLHRDGSGRAWLEGATPLDLIVTLDDATGTIYSAFLVEEEGAASTFRAFKEVFGEHGLPHTLNGFRPAHLTPSKASDLPDRSCAT
jgi:hypothetical protein